jgi:hypothetical protein
MVMEYDDGVADMFLTLAGGRRGILGAMTPIPRPENVQAS